MLLSKPDLWPGAGLEVRELGCPLDRPPQASEGASPRRFAPHRGNRASKARARPCGARCQIESPRRRAVHAPCVPCPIKRFIRLAPVRPPPRAPLRSALT